MEGKKWKVCFAKMNKTELGSLAQSLTEMEEIIDRPEMAKIKEEFSLWGIKTLHHLLHDVIVETIEQPRKPIAKKEERTYIDGMSCPSCKTGKMFIKQSHQNSIFCECGYSETGGRA